MRWDNPKAQDWFDFPDLAAFPDYADEPRHDEAFDLFGMEQAVHEKNQPAFLQEVAKYTDINQPWVKKLVQQFNFYRPHGKSDEKHGASNNCFQGLYQEGIYVTDIDFNGLVKKSLVDELLAKPDWNPQPGSYDRGTYLDSKQVATVHNKFKDAGILEGASYYLSSPKRVAGAFLHISTPTDKHYKQFFMDATTTPYWTNLHIDPKEQVVKAIVYLNDVYESNGAFGFVPESNRYRYSALTEIFGRAITVGNYCKTPEERSHIFKLPAPLRVSYNFGRCIMDGSRTDYALRDRFLRVTSNIGNVAVFDPGAGMHQGGICKDDNRISLQVLMK